MAIEAISYCSATKDLILQPPMELKSPNSSITKIEIKTESEEGLILSFFLHDVLSENEAKSITFDIARALKNKISFRYGLKIREPIVKNFIEDGYLSIRESSAALTELGAITTIHESNQENFRNYLENYRDNENNEFLHLYCFIITNNDNNDPISRFILLYSLLELITNGTQKEIDKLILSIDSCVPKTISDCGKSSEETLFTRLRNEIMHPKDRKKKLTDVKEEMKNNVDWLQDIVKKHLESII